MLFYGYTLHVIMGRCCCRCLNIYFVFIFLFICFLDYTTFCLILCSFWNLLNILQLVFCSYSRADEDYEGYDYSLVGQLSEVRIIYLNRFLQEVAVDLLSEYDYPEYIFDSDSKVNLLGYKLLHGSCSGEFSRYHKSKRSENKCREVLH